MAKDKKKRSANYIGAADELVRKAKADPEGTAASVSEWESSQREQAIQDRAAREIAAKNLRSYIQRHPSFSRSQKDAIAAAILRETTDINAAHRRENIGKAQREIQSQNELTSNPYAQAMRKTMLNQERARLDSLPGFSVSELDALDDDERNRRITDWAKRSAAVDRGLKKTNQSIDAYNAAMARQRNDTEQEEPNKYINNPTAQVMRMTMLNQERARLDSLPGMTLDEVRDYDARSAALDKALRETNKNLDNYNTRRGLERVQQNARQDPEFAKYAQRGNAIENPSYEDVQNSGWRIFGKQIGGVKIPNEVTYARTNADKLAEYEPAIVNVAEKQRALYRHMTNDEVDTYNYLLAKDNENGTHDADDYLGMLTETLRDRQSAAINDYYVQTANEHPVLATATNIIGSPLKGTAVVSAALDRIRGREIDQNSGAMQFARGMDTMTSTISGNINEDVYKKTDSAFLANASSFVYDTGVSIAQSAFNTLSTGGNAIASSLMMSGSAGASAMQEALDGGATDDQALAVGGWAALFEALFEKVSIENFVNMSSPAAKGAVVKNILKQMGIEASEESATEIADIISESWIMGENSQYRDKSAAELAFQVFMSGLGGAVSGGVMGSFGQASNYLGARSIGRAAQQLNLQDQILADAAASSDKSASDLAKAMQRGTAKSSASNLGRVYASLVENGDYSNYDTEVILRAAAEEAAAEKQQKKSGKTAQRQTASQNDQNAPESVSSQEQTNRTNTEENAQQTRKQPRVDYATNVVDNEEADITGIHSVEDGTVYVQAGDNVVALNDVEFANADIGELYERAGKYGTEAAQRFVKAYDGGSVEQYAKGFDAMYRAARDGVAYDTALQQSLYVENYLSEDQRMQAYAAGQSASAQTQTQVATNQEQVATEQQVEKPQNNGVPAAVQTEAKAAQQVKKAVKPGLTRSYARAELTNEQRSAIKKNRGQLQVVDAMAKKYGREVVLVGSLQGMEINGQTVEQSANGVYDPSSGRIYIAADAQDGAFAYVAMHELAHSVRAASEIDYNALQTTVFDALTKDGQNVDDLVKYQMDTFGYSEDVAREEVVANSAATVLTDEEFVRNLYNNEHSLFEKIRKFFKELADTFKQLTQSASWSQDAALTPENVRAIAEVFDRVATDTAATLNEEGAVYNKSGEAVAYSDGKGGIRLSERTYREGGRDTLRDYLTAQTATGELSKADAQDILDQTDRIYKIVQENGGKYESYSNWANAKVVVDDNGNPVFSVVKANGEYAMNLDFSLVCKKRRTLNAVFNEMIARGIIDNFNLAQTEIVQINDIIREHGFETACALCFVDSKRFRQAKVADDFVKMYNSAVRSMAGDKPIDSFNFGGDKTVKPVQNGIDKMSDSDLDLTRINRTLESGKKGTVAYKIAEHLKNNPSDRKLVARGDFMSSNGFDAIKQSNPEILKLYNSKKGSGGPKASFGDVQYLSDIIRDGKFYAAAAFAVGGVRVQSFSDYVPRLVFDYVQMIADLSAKNLPAHSYTKEELFVKQFGLTGMKINMSLIPAVVAGHPAGLDANGNYAWAKESFDYDTAVEIQGDPAYARNCGTICVGVSDEHIRKLMKDPNIRMIIPYHKSGLNPLVAEMNNIRQFSDYTNSQNTRYANGKKLSKEDQANDFNFNQRLHELGAEGDPRAVVEEYVRWCEQNDYLPKFDKFAYVRDSKGNAVLNADGQKVVDPDYYKLIEDFTVYDGEGIYSPQEAVRPVYPDENSAFGSMADLIERGLAEDQALTDKRAENVGAIVDEIAATLKPKGELKLSVKDVEPADAKKLQRENDNLKGALDNARAQLNLVKGMQVSEQSVRGIARDIASEYKSEVDVQQFADDLQTLFAHAAQSGKTKAAYSEFNDLGIGLAQKVIEASPQIDTKVSDQFSPLKDFFAANELKLDEVQKKELAKMYGSYYNFQKRYRDVLRFSDDGVALSDAMETIAQTYPYLYDKASGDSAVIGLLDAMDMMRPTLENPHYDRIESASADLWLDIQQRYTGTDDVRAFAGEHAAELDALRADQQENLSQLRSEGEYNKKLLREHGVSVARRRAEINKAKADARQTVREQQKERVSVRTYKDRIKAAAMTLSAWNTSPSDKRFVPEGLRRAVSDFVSAIDMGFKEGSKVSENWKARMRQMQIAVENAQRSSPDVGMATWDQETVDNLASLAALIEGNDNIKSLRDLSEPQLKALADVLNGIKHEVINANKMFVNGRRESLSKAADSEIERMGSRKTGKVREQLQKIMGSKLMLGNTKPIFLMDSLGGEYERIGRDLFNGQTEAAFILRDSKDFHSGLKKRYHVDKWLDQKGDVLTLNTEFGDTIRLSRGQALDVYEMYQREQQDTHTRHLADGGIVFKTDADGKRVDDTTAHPISEADIQQITSWLTDEQIAYADALVRYMSTTLAEVGNKTSLTLSGYKKYTGQHYVPFNSASDYIAHGAGQADGQQTPHLKNWGHGKSINAFANNPVVVESIDQIFGHHAEEMAMYAGLAIPQDNMIRYLNYKQPNEQGKRQTSMKSALRAAYGDNVVRYIDRFNADVGGKITADVRDQEMGVMLSKFKKGAVLASMSVVVQQPTAYFRAFSMMNPKYMRLGWTGAYQEAQQYAGTAIIKDIGGFDMQTSMGAADWILDKKPSGPIEWSDKVFGTLPEKADAVTWGALWNSVKAEIHGETGLAMDSEALLKAAGKRFDEVIDFTQVYDSTFSRSDWMRSKSKFGSMVTAFMAEPTTSMNMFMYSLLHIKDKNYSGKVHVIPATLALAATTIINAAVKAVVYAARNDDDYATFWEKYLAQLKSALFGDKIEGLPDWLGTPLGFVAGSDFSVFTQIPLVSDVMELAQGYDVTRTDMNVVGDVVDAALGLFNEKKTVYTKVKNLIGAVGNLTGLPVKNLWRDVESVVRLFGVEIPAATGGTADGYAKLYETIASGDEKRAGELRDTLEGKGKSSKDIDTGVAKSLMENDERIRQAYEMKDEGDIAGLEELRAELAETYGEEVVDKAIKLYENSLNSDLKKEAEALLESESRIAELYDYSEKGETPDAAKEEALREQLEKQYGKELVEKALFVYSEQFDELDSALYTADDMELVGTLAFESGKTADLKTVVAEMEKDSKATDPKKSVLNKAVTAFKPSYTEALDKGYAQKAARIKKVLLDVYGSYGLTEERIDKWLPGDKADALYEAVDEGASVQSLNKLIKDAKAAGQKDSNIINRISSTYKEKMLEAWQKGDTRTYNQIASLLKNLNLYDSKGKLYYTDERFKDWQMAEKYDDLPEAVRAGDAGAVKQYVANLKKDGYSDGQITQRVSTNVHDELVEAYLKGDMSTYNKLKAMLQSLDLHDKRGNQYYPDSKIAKWIKDAQEKK